MSVTNENEEYDKWQCALGVAHLRMREHLEKRFPRGTWWRVKTVAGQASTRTMKVVGYEIGCSMSTVRFWSPGRKRYEFGGWIRAFARDVPLNRIMVRTDPPEGET